MPEKKKWENKPGQGAIFKNLRKSDDDAADDADYRGDHCVKCPHCQGTFHEWIAARLRGTAVKDGGKGLFFALSFQVKRDRANKPVGQPSNAPPGAPPGSGPATSAPPGGKPAGRPPGPETTEFRERAAPATPAPDPYTLSPASAPSPYTLSTASRTPPPPGGSTRPAPPIGGGSSRPPPPKR